MTGIGPSFVKLVLTMAIETSALLGQLAPDIKLSGAFFMPVFFPLTPTRKKHKQNNHNCNYVQMN